jgi:hypothetical protein
MPVHEAISAGAPLLCLNVNDRAHRMRVVLLREHVIGAEIVLSVDGDWRRSRLFRSHEQAELVGAIADTRAMFEGKGWA